VASSWFLFFSYHNDARSNKHLMAHSDLDAGCLVGIICRSYTSCLSTNVK
jgi:hypothetical protein